MQIFKELPPQLDNNTYVALDIEIFGLNPKQLHRPTSGKFACLSICYEPNKVYLIENQFEIPKALSKIKDAIWILHNAKFDLTHLRRWAYISPRKKLWDTMLKEKILWGGYYEFFALEHLARRYLDIFIDKSLQKSFEKAEELSDEQRQYAAQDANITFQVFQKQRKHVTKKDFKVWQEVDLPALWAVMDFQGFAINKSRWEALAEINKAKADEIEKELPFNSKSPKQVKEALSKNGFPRLPNTQEKTLNKFINKYPEVDATQLAKKILEARKLAKRASTYGLKFIENYLETDIVSSVDIIHCDYHVTGAETGRMASSQPNMQNIPVKDTKDFRYCFIARPKNKLIIADYGQQELRIAAYLSQDEELIKLLAQTDKDVFIQMVKLIYKKNVKKSDPLRSKVKNFTYGITYGLSIPAFAEQAEIGIDEAEEVQNLFFSRFSGLYQYLNEQEKKKTKVETVLGRKIWLNRYSHQCENNAKNGPIQGTAADMLKMALAKIHQDWQFPYPFAVVGAIHDEIVLDVPKAHAQEIADFVKERMVKVAEDICLGVKFTASAVIGDNWGSKE